MINSILFMFLGAALGSSIHGTISLIITKGKLPPEVLAAAKKLVLNAYCASLFFIGCLLLNYYYN